jgi:hypothetical protein
LHWLRERADELAGVGHGSSLLVGLKKPSQAAGYLHQKLKNTSGKGHIPLMLLSVKSDDVWHLTGIAGLARKAGIAGASDDAHYDDFPSAQRTVISRHFNTISSISLETHLIAFKLIQFMPLQLH